MQIGSASSLPVASAQSRPASTGSVLEEEREAAAQRKLDQAREALTKLTAMRDQQKDTAKAVARKKVAELRARLKALKLLFANNPKALAREAAKLSRELGAAVKGYAAAGGSAGEMGSASVSVPNDEAGGAAAAGAAPGDGAAEMGTAAKPEAPASGEDADKPLPNKTGDTGAREADAYRQRLEQQRADGRGRGEQADAEFAREARDLARQIRALMQGLKAKQGRPQEAQAAEHALDGVEQDLSASAAGMAGVAAPGSMLSLSA